MLRAKTYQTINELKDFISTENIGREDIIFQSTNLSGGHDIVYMDGEDGASSVVSGDTAAERAVYNGVGDNKPLNATQIAASGGRTFTFDEAAGTLTLSSGTMLATEGFHDNMEITVAGTSDNNGTFLAATVTDTIITIDADADTDLYSVTFTDEGPLGATATLDGEQAGFSTNGASNLHVVFNLPDGTTDLDWSLYTWDSVSEVWSQDTRVGTAGVLNVTDVLSAQRIIIELGGIQKVALVVANKNGTFTTGYSAWMMLVG